MHFQHRRASPGCDQRTQNFNKEVYSLQIRELVVIGVYAHTEEQSCIAAVDNLVITKLRSISTPHDTTHNLDTHLYEI